MEFAGGDLNRKVDGKSAARVHVQNGRANLQIPAGEHRVELAR
jgi:uncharacterized membrane protein